MTRASSLLRSALALFSLRLLLQQAGVALLVVLLSLVWLRIPDASALDVAFSVLLALLILAIAGAGQSSIILRLTHRPRNRARLLRGAMLLFAGAALWIACSNLIDRLRVADTLRAGYFNSRFSASLRNFFSFSHLLLWQQWFWTLLLCLCTGLIAMLVFDTLSSVRPLRAIKLTLRSLTYWSVAVLAPFATALFGSLLLGWTPGRGLRAELLSLVLRLALAVLLDTAAACLLLTTLAALVMKADDGDIIAPVSHTAPAGTPETSHPRTAGSP